MSSTLALDECKPGLSMELAEAIQKQQLSSRISHTYQHWITQYLAYFDLTSPTALTEKNIKEFLRYVRRNLSLSRARLNQAREAIIFLYEKVLKKPIKEQDL